MTRQHGARYTQRDLFSLAGRSGRDPRSVRCFLDGGKVKLMTAEAIEHALVELGLEHLRPNDRKVPEAVGALPKEGSLHGTADGRPKP